MIYFDTSFLAPLLLEEATSAGIEEFMLKLPAGQLAISDLVRIEFSSVLGRQVRMGQLPPAQAREIDRKFEEMIRASFEVWLASREDHDLAKDMLSNHQLGLRAPDALHLAIAKTHTANAFYTLDRALLRAGKALELPVSTGIPLPGYEAS